MKILHGRGTQHVPDAFAALFEFQKAWEKPLIKYLVVLVHLIIFHSFHLIFIAFEKLKPIPGISKKQKKKRRKKKETMGTHNHSLYPS